MNPAPRCVLFDLDGTLIDTAPDLGGALNDLRIAQGLSALPLSALRPYCSQGARGLIRAGFQLDDDAPAYPALHERFLVLYSQRLDRASRAFAGIEALLAGLEARGASWGVVTNKPRRYAEPLMQSLGYASRMACLVAGDDVAQPKPAPDALLAACALTGHAPMQCLYVGDDRRDIDAARAAGMPVVAAAWGYIAADDDIEDWRADAVIPTPQALADRLRTR